MNKQAEIEQAYWSGFATKCAEYGVDATKLAQAAPPPWLTAIRKGVGRGISDGGTAGIDAFSSTMGNYMDHNNPAGLGDRESRVLRDLGIGGAALASVGTYGVAQGLQRLFGGKAEDKAIARRRRLRSLITAAIAAAGTGAAGAGMYLDNKRIQAMD